MSLADSGHPLWATHGRGSNSHGSNGRHQPPQQFDEPPRNRLRLPSAKRYGSSVLVPRLRSRVAESGRCPPLSNRIVSIPLRSSSSAMVMPATPPPTITTSACSVGEPSSRRASTIM